MTALRFIRSNFSWDGGQCHPTMSDYRRYFVAGGTYFFTIVTYQRRTIFANPDNVQHLRVAIGDVQETLPFAIHAAVVLPDHIHFIWSLPVEDAAYSKRIGMMKVNFTRRLRESGWRTQDVSPSRRKHRESDVWQRRFWEHTVRDEDEFEQLFDYIHFNPVKHGHVSCPRKWQTSSYHRWVDRGVIEPTWGCSCHNRHIQPPPTRDNIVGE